MIIQYVKSKDYQPTDYYYDEGLAMKQSCGDILIFHTKGRKANQITWEDLAFYSIEIKDVPVENNIYRIYSDGFGDCYAKRIQDTLYYTGTNFTYSTKAELIYKSNLFELSQKYKVGDYSTKILVNKPFNIFKVIDVFGPNMEVEDCFTKEKSIQYNGGGLVLDAPKIDTNINTKRIVKMPTKLAEIFPDLKDVNKIVFDNLGKYLLADLDESLTILKYNIKINKSLCNYDNLYYDYIKEKTYSIISNKKVYIPNDITYDKICSQCGNIMKNPETHKCKIYCPKCGKVLKTLKEIKNEICIACKEKYVNHYNSHWAKKEPIFEKPDKREKTMHFGIELEIDSGTDYRSSSKKTQTLKEIYKINSKDIFNPLCYTESDGSLSGNGIEMVFNPKTLSWFKKHKNQEELKGLFKKFIENNYTSHNNGKCGLHIHVDRKTLGVNHKYTAGKIVFFVNKLWDDYFLPLSRREKSRDGVYYCKKLTVFNKDTELDLHQKAASDRYVLVNCSNAGTIEFRLWRGTLNMDSFLNSIYLTNSIIKFCRKKSLNSLQRITFKDFYKTLSDYEKEYCRVKLHKTEEEICV